MVLPSSFFRGNSGAIDSRAKASGDHRVNPRKNVSVLRVRHPAAFFLIEENHSARMKAFLLCERDGRMTVDFSDLGRIRGRLQLVRAAAVEKHKKTKAIFESAARFPVQSFDLRAGRNVEPVASERERALQCGQGGVAGIFVRVEAEVRKRSCRKLRKRETAAECEGAMEAAD